MSGLKWQKARQRRKDRPKRKRAARNPGWQELYSPRSEKILIERARLLNLVRTNGFPECKATVRFSRLRQYLKEHGIAY